MKVLVDTSVWSMAFRKNPQSDAPSVRQLYQFISSGHTVCYTGIILTELLQGIRSDAVFKQIEKHFDALEFIELSKEEYVRAAALSQKCRRAGISASTIDYLIAATAIENSCSLLTTDKDFQHIASVSALSLVKI